MICKTMYVAGLIVCPGAAGRRRSTITLANNTRVFLDMFLRFVLFFRSSNPKRNLIAVLCPHQNTPTLVFYEQYQLPTTPAADMPVAMHASLASTGAVTGSSATKPFTQIHGIFVRSSPFATTNPLSPTLQSEFEKQHPVSRRTCEQTAISSRLVLARAKVTPRQSGICAIVCPPLNTTVETSALWRLKPNTSASFLVDFAFSNAWYFCLRVKPSTPTSSRGPFLFTSTIFLGLQSKHEGKKHPDASVRFSPSTQHDFPKRSSSTTV